MKCLVFTNSKATLNLGRVSYIKFERFLRCGRFEHGFKDDDQATQMAAYETMGIAS